MRPWLVPPPARHGAVIRMMQAPAVVALAAVLAVSTSPATAAVAAPPQEEADQGGGGAASTLCNVPPTLSGEDKQAEKIKHPKSASAMRCTSKCVSTCILGGAGSPGVEGPFNIRRPLVVFKEDFRSRQYWYTQFSCVNFACKILIDSQEHKRRTVHSS
uniref:Epidermal patterning factor-like protein n=1 Tax=Oryza punctata TaxID=4537 RepID=A0A0E0JVC0_ORYPU